MKLPMKRSLRFYVWILNASANLASWTIDMLARNIQLFMNIALAILIAILLYTLVKIIAVSQPLAILIGLLITACCFVIFEIADCFVWLMLPAKYYGRFLISMIRLRLYIRGNSILLVAGVIDAAMQTLERILRPFNQSAAAAIHTITSDFRDLSNVLRANEFAKLQAT